jgi:hypothetical protein
MIGRGMRWNNGLGRCATTRPCNIKCDQAQVVVELPRLGVGDLAADYGRARTVWTEAFRTPTRATGGGMSHAPPTDIAGNVTIESAVCFAGGNSLGRAVGFNRHTRTRCRLCQFRSKVEGSDRGKNDSSNQYFTHGTLLLITELSAKHATRDTVAQGLSNQG